MKPETRGNLPYKRAYSEMERIKAHSDNESPEKKDPKLGLLIIVAGTALSWSVLIYALL